MVAPYPGQNAQATAINTNGVAVGISGATIAQGKRRDLSEWCNYTELFAGCGGSPQRLTMRPCRPGPRRLSSMGRLSERIIPAMAPSGITPLYDGTVTNGYYFKNLTELVPQSSTASTGAKFDWQINTTTGISDSGAIVGTATLTTTVGGTTTSTSHGVLLLPATVTSVSFDGTNYWQLESDDGTTNYVAPQWTDTNGNYNASDPGEHNYAAAYTCNTKPKIGATLKIPGASNWTNLKFKATGPDGISIPATAPSSISGDTVTMPVTESTTDAPQHDQILQQSRQHSVHVELVNERGRRHDLVDD